MNKVLILGVNGFTGKHFQDYIVRNNLKEHYSFIGADKKIEKIIDIDYREVDFLKRNNLQQLIKESQPNYVINFAGIINSDDFDVMIKINSGIARKIFDTVVKYDVPIQKILLVGSAAEYGINYNLPLMEEAKLYPITLYSLSKIIQTYYTFYNYNKFKIKVNVARTFNVIGKGMSRSLSISSFLHQILEAKDGDNIYVGNMHTKRDFLDISDVVDAYWKILLRGKAGLIYNVCRGSSNYIRDILDYMIFKSGKKINIVLKDNRIRKDDVLDIYGDNSRLVMDTEWNYQVGIYEAIDKLFED